MEVVDFLEVSNTNYKTDNNNLLVSQIYTLKDSIKIQDFNVAIVGVTDLRNSSNKGAVSAADTIREQLFKFAKTSKNLKILDLGNVKKGKTVGDSYVAFKEVVKECLGYGMPVVVIGASQDFTYPASEVVFHNHKYPVLTTIDSVIDLELAPKRITNKNFLYSIWDRFPHTRFVNVGHQEYFVESSIIEWYKQKYFALCRLGEMSSKLDLEPFMRDADIVSFDFGAIKNSDSVAVETPVSAGMTGEDACQLSWYSGFSEKLKVFFLSEVAPKYDQRNVGSLLAAQIVWHVLDGVSQRKSDSFDDLEENFTRFFVTNEYTNQDLVFYESKKTKNMWVEVPVTNNGQNRLLPCSVLDYQKSMVNLTPDNWLLEFNRLFKKR